VVTADLFMGELSLVVRKGPRRLDFPRRRTWPRVLFLKVGPKLLDPQVL
jgi:hypothetical protein